jgi:hypothetical protein
MSNNLHVTLDQSASPSSLDVDQQGNANHVGQSPNAQVIIWQLTGNAAAGSFLALTDPTRGFAWVPPAPSPGIFSNPTLSPNGNQLTVTDLNNSTNTTGTYYYVLRATIGGQVYSTINTSIAATTTNPCIKNN